MQASDVINPLSPGINTLQENGALAQQTMVSVAQVKNGCQLRGTAMFQEFPTPG